MARWIDRQMQGGRNLELQSVFHHLVPEMRTAGAGHEVSRTFTTSHTAHTLGSRFGSRIVTVEPLSELTDSSRAAPSLRVSEPQRFAGKRPL